MDIKIRSRVGEIARHDWDLLANSAPPVLEHAFLTALEDAGCVGGETGWHPAAITAEERGELLGVAPAYLKLHSMGEFVYDWAWANAAHQAGHEYYPKLVLTAPFSPIPGPCLLVRPGLTRERADAVRIELLNGAVALARDNHCQGVHLLFCTQEELAVAQSLGFMARLGSQLHWSNRDYAEFDDFLGRFRSKRRNQIRRERRRLRQQGVTVRCLAGAELEGPFREHAFELYRRTVDLNPWGRRYLNGRFFELLWQRLPERLRMTVAEHRGEVLAAAVDLAGDDRRHGRYWGTYRDVHSLHFEVCAYAPVEDCIRRGLSAFEAGAGDYTHKLDRGFLPVYTHSAHLLFKRDLHGALASFCRREERYLRDQVENLPSPFAR